ncbi:MAG: hypothetical protein KGN36_10000 [Acidobacteriota bacterium]|nr:hypothetical protein [Acidobacteriota bacterium]
MAAAGIRPLLHELFFHRGLLPGEFRPHLTFTVTQISSGAVVATGALDQSGTGTITYSNGGKAVIANWVLAD